MIVAVHFWWSMSLPFKIIKQKKKKCIWRKHKVDADR